MRVIFTLLFLSLGLINISSQSLKSGYDLPFRGGEKVIYTLKYGLLVGGEAHIEINTDTYQGQKVFHATALGKTVGLVDKLFGVEDIYQSYFDPETNKPYKSIRDIHEGNYERYNAVTFYHKDSLVYSQKSGYKKVPAEIYDMVSALFYIRRLDYSKMKIGDRIKLDTYFDDDLFPFDVRYEGKGEIKTALGKIKCHKLVPVVEPGRIFKNDDDMTVWITDDKNLLPVRIEFDLIVGSVKCDLKEYKNVKYSLNFE